MSCFQTVPVFGHLVFGHSKNSDHSKTGCPNTGNVWKPEWFVSNIQMAITIWKQDICQVFKCEAFLAAILFWPMENRTNIWFSNGYSYELVWFSRHGLKTYHLTLGHFLMIPKSTSEIRTVRFYRIQFLSDRPNGLVFECHSKTGRRSGFLMVF